MRLRRGLVGAAAGAAGAAAWLAAERPLGRLLGTGYSEVDAAEGALRLAGARSRRGAKAIHVALGAGAGGAALLAPRRRSWLGLAAVAELELALAWPVMRRLVPRRETGVRALADAAAGRAILASAIALADRSV